MGKASSLLRRNMQSQHCALCGAFSSLSIERGSDLTTALYLNVRCVRSDVIARDMPMGRADCAPMQAGHGVGNCGMR